METRCPGCGHRFDTQVASGLRGNCPKCLAGFVMEPVPPLSGDFRGLEILGVIGEGGMGKVYRARHPQLGRDVAVKTLAPALAGDPEFVERFMREARALATLDHPNIVRVYDVGSDNDVCFITMEFVDGVPLRSAMQAGLAPREALSVIGQICDALEYAHGRGVVHRDIKPENILIDRAGRVKIADFGLAKIKGEGPGVTRTDVAIGTPHYMAPEQIERMKDVDHRADIYSLGVVFYEMLTGELPLGKFSPPSARKSQLDARLDEVVMRTLEKEPERRYQRAREVKDHVTRIGDSAVVDFARPLSSVLLSRIGTVLLISGFLTIYSLAVLPIPLPTSGIVSLAGGLPMVAGALLLAVSLRSGRPNRAWVAPIASCVLAGVALCTLVSAAVSTRVEWARPWEVHIQTMLAVAIVTGLLALGLGIGRRHPLLDLGKRRYALGFALAGLLLFVTAAAHFALYKPPTLRVDLIGSRDWPGGSLALPIVPKLEPKPLDGAAFRDAAAKFERGIDAREEFLAMGRGAAERIVVWETKTSDQLRRLHEIVVLFWPCPELADRRWSGELMHVLRDQLERGSDPHRHVDEFVASMRLDRRTIQELEYALHALGMRATDYWLGGVAALLGLRVVNELVARGDDRWLAYAHVFFNSPWTNMRVRTWRPGLLTEGPSVYCDAIANQINAACAGFLSMPEARREPIAVAFADLAPTLAIWNVRAVWLLAATADPSRVFHRLAAAYEKRPDAHLLAAIDRVTYDAEICRAFWQDRADEFARGQLLPTKHWETSPERWAPLHVADGLRRAMHPELSAQLRKMSQKCFDAPVASGLAIFRLRGGESLDPREASRNRRGDPRVPEAVAVACALTGECASDWERECLSVALREEHPFHAMGVAYAHLLAEAARKAARKDQR